MKKKVYIKPEMKVYEIEPTVILAGSERCILYDEIPFEIAVCDPPTLGEYRTHIVLLTSWRLPAA